VTYTSILISIESLTQSLFCPPRDFSHLDISFRQVLNGTPKPDDFRIVHRILAGSDLTRRNSRGQTALFEAMRERLPIGFLNSLVRYGVSLVSRDYLGRSPRDYAAALARDDYVHWVDGHVTGAVFRRDTERVLGWIVNGYDHVMHVLQHATDERGHRLMDKLAADQCMRRTAAAINTIPKVKVRWSRDRRYGCFRWGWMLVSPPGVTVNVVVLWK